MNGWIDGWMDEWMDRWMDRWIDDKWINSSSVKVLPISIGNRYC